MKFRFSSIRQRLQFGIAVIVIIATGTSGSAIYLLERTNCFRRIDREMFPGVVCAIEALPSSPNRDAFVDALSESNGHVESRQLIDDQKPNGFYLAVWSTNDAVLHCSSGVPVDISAPVRSAVAGIAHRTRGDLREVAISTDTGVRAVVGHSIADEMNELHRFAWTIAAIAGVVILLGVIAGRCLGVCILKSITQLSKRAEKILSGNLTERISTVDDDELCQLADVLNASFDRQQNAFEHLQWSLERQTRFTTDASHELRTPVAVVLAEANSALAQERTPEEYQEAMESCRRAARRMHRLIESLLTLAALEAKVDGVTRQRCQLDRVAQEAVDLLRPLAVERNIKLSIETVAATCSGDPDQLAQVVINLISNAIYYNHPGGEVCVSVCVKNDDAMVIVSDTGKGIAGSDLPHIFKRFYRADKSRARANGRSGLGLAIAKTIVDRHDGRIDVRSELGKGSSFIVSFPQAT